MGHIPGYGPDPNAMRHQRVEPVDPEAPVCEEPIDCVGYCLYHYSPCGGCSKKIKPLTWIQKLRPGRPPRQTGPTRLDRVGLAAIRGYQRWISPRINARCRHVPSCSAFGYEAVVRYGLILGSRLTAGRINRCVPSTPFGTPDPVP